MGQPRTVLIVNPQSQNGALGRRWPELARVIRRHVEFEEVRTRGPGDATRLATEALTSGAERVVAIGGDGTINEVANGFFDGTRPVSPGAALGILPFGTGGDFRKTLRLPRDTERAAELLSTAAARPIDVGHLAFRDGDGAPASRIFVNIASFGISGMVDRLVNESSKRLGGRLSFMLGTARAAVRYRNQRVQLTFDGDVADRVEMTINTVAVANGRYFGGGMFIAPDAELDDGYFDVVALGDIGLRDMLTSSRRLYSGTHLGLDKVSHRRARTVHAEPLDDEPVELDVDGEAPGILPATFTIIPSALPVVMPGAHGGS